MQGLMFCMNRKVGEVALIFLFAGVLLISGCNEQIEPSVKERNLPIDMGRLKQLRIKILLMPEKGMRVWTSR